MSSSQLTKSIIFQRGRLVNQQPDPQGSSSQEVGMMPPCFTSQRFECLQLVYIYNDIDIYISVQLSA